MDTMVLERPKVARNKLNTAVLTANSAVDMEDFKLLRLMNEARSEGLADTQETLTKLGIAV
jgi:hypothetical protein